MTSAYCIGIDYGTDSVRTIIVDAQNGHEVASAVFEYPRWKKGLYCDAAEQRFRQHPLDYLEGLEYTVKECLKQAGQTVANNIKAISVDTTGSTPVAVNEQGTPLSLLPAFAEDPDAMFILWKDHSATTEALQINEHARSFATNYLKYSGGVYSSEWFWSKLLHVLRVNTGIQQHCYSWVEHCDWIPFVLSGGTHASEIKRSVCTAGHKALWSEEWGGLPPGDFFVTLDPLLENYAFGLYDKVYTSDQPAGKLSAEWADKLGLSTEVIVGIGAMDAHMGAVGGQVEPFYLTKVIGTSTCDMLTVPNDQMKGRVVNGICGQVNGSILPGMIGLEAGQSSFGDTYAWFRKLLLWPVQTLLPGLGIDGVDTNALEEKLSSLIIPALDAAAAQLGFDEKSESALDWFNGRRTPDANPLVQGSISGLHLGSDAPRIYRALVEATCFGAKRIVERFTEQGIEIKGITGVGGIARKSAFVMQTLADVLNMPIRISRSEQTCALGATMFAATASGIYASVQEAMAAMGGGFDKEFIPDQVKTQLYSKRYLKYIADGRFTEFPN